MELNKQTILQNIFHSVLTVRKERLGKAKGT